MKHEILQSRRDLLAAVSSVGLFMGVASGQSEQDSEISNSHAVPRGPPYDLVVANRRSSSQSIKMSVKHIKTSQGTQLNIKLGSKFQKDYRKEVDNLPKAPGKYEVIVEINEDNIVRQTIRIAERNQRGSIKIKIEKEGLDIGVLMG